MGKLLNLVVVMLLITCKSALAETVYYCVTGNNSTILVDDVNDEVHTHESSERFVLKVNKTNVRFEGPDAGGAWRDDVVFEIVHYDDDRKWYARGATYRHAPLDRALWVAFFEYPNFVVSSADYSSASNYIAKCETF